LHANTALHLAAQNGQIGVAQKLIEAGANVNAPNAHKHIPLHLAAQNGHLNLSKLLVQSGTDLDFKDLIGESQAPNLKIVFLFKINPSLTTFYPEVDV